MTSDENDSDGFDTVAMLIVMIVAITAGFLGLQILDQFTGFDEAVCNDNLGNEWDYVNGSLIESNRSILCEAPNGTTVRVQRPQNVTGAMA